jgi:hypothetical protein
MVRKEWEDYDKHREPKRIQTSEAIPPKPETTVEKIKRYAAQAGKTADQITKKPAVKATIKYLRERGEDVGRDQRPAKPMAVKTPQKPQRQTTKPPRTPKPIRQVGRIQKAGPRAPPAYVVENGQTLAAQLDPFGIQGGVIGNYERLTTPKTRGQRTQDNPFGL